MKVLSVDLEAIPSTIVIEHKRLFRSPVIKTYLYVGMGTVPFHYWVCKETGEIIRYTTKLGMTLDSLMATGKSFKFNEPENAWGEIA